MGMIALNNRPSSNSHHFIPVKQLRFLSSQIHSKPLRYARLFQEIAWATSGDFVWNTKRQEMLQFHFQNLLFSSQETKRLPRLTAAFVRTRHITWDRGPRSYRAKFVSLTAASAPKIIYLIFLFTRNWEVAGFNNARGSILLILSGLAVGEWMTSDFMKSTASPYSLPRDWSANLIYTWLNQVRLLYYCVRDVQMSFVLVHLHNKKKLEIRN